jgi:hypothetical protein
VLSRQRPSQTPLFWAHASDKPRRQARGTFSVWTVRLAKGREKRSLHTGDLSLVAAMQTWETLSRQSTVYGMTGREYYQVLDAGRTVIT